jgi:SAM-dependent methyltransferase
MELYDKDYYEHGIETGKSNYQNYRWIPELTIPMAMTIIDFLQIAKGEMVLDFGCAKGYLVKALRMLHRNAWGVDISSYALSFADPEIRSFLVNDLNKLDGLNFKYIICKDVLEHITEFDLRKLLISFKARKLFSVIPLGDNGVFVAPSNQTDVTHITCRPRDWWLTLFEETGWSCTYESLRVDGIKDSYYDKYPDAHLFTIHTR